ncbi:MAG: hypothetical protein HYY58_04440 [Candidatus Omnitrophica bacterium]|nr:hypothetical protein [Candidatus Omnitrophota bacterium]
MSAAETGVTTNAIVQPHQAHGGLIKAQQAPSTEPDVTALQTTPALFNEIDPTQNPNVQTAIQVRRHPDFPTVHELTYDLATTGQGFSGEVFRFVNGDLSGLPELTLEDPVTGQPIHYGQAILFQARSDMTTRFQLEVYDRQGHRADFRLTIPGTPPVPGQRLLWVDVPVPFDQILRRNPAFRLDQFDRAAVTFIAPGRPNAVLQPTGTLWLFGLGTDQPPPGTASALVVPVAGEPGALSPPVTVLQTLSPIPFQPLNSPAGIIQVRRRADVPTAMDVTYDLTSPDVDAVGAAFPLAPGPQRDFTRLPPVTFTDRSGRVRTEPALVFAVLVPPGSTRVFQGELKDGLGNPAPFAIEIPAALVGQPVAVIAPLAQIRQARPGFALDDVREVAPTVFKRPDPRDLTLQPAVTTPRGTVSVYGVGTEQLPPGTFPVIVGPDDGGTPTLLPVTGARNLGEGMGLTFADARFARRPGTLPLQLSYDRRPNQPAAWIFPFGTTPQDLSQQPFDVFYAAGLAGPEGRVPFFTVKIALEGGAEHSFRVQLPQSSDPQSGRIIWHTVTLPWDRIDRSKVVGVTADFNDPDATSGRFLFDGFNWLTLPAGTRQTPTTFQLRPPVPDASDPSRRLGSIVQLGDARLTPMMSPTGQVAVELHYTRAGGVEGLLLKLGELDREAIAGNNGVINLPIACGACTQATAPLVQVIVTDEAGQQAVFYVPAQPGDPADRVHPLDLKQFPNLNRSRLKELVILPFTGSGSLKLGGLLTARALADNGIPFAPIPARILDSHPTGIPLTFVKVPVTQVLDPSSGQLIPVLGVGSVGPPGTSVVEGNRTLFSPYRALELTATIGPGTPREVGLFLQFAPGQDFSTPRPFPSNPTDEFMFSVLDQYGLLPGPLTIQLKDRAGRQATFTASLGGRNDVRVIALPLQQVRDLIDLTQLDVLTILLPPSPNRVIDFGPAALGKSPFLVGFGIDKVPAQSTSRLTRTSATIQLAERQYQQALVRAERADSREARREADQRVRSAKDRLDRARQAQERAIGQAAQPSVAEPVDRGQTQTEVAESVTSLEPTLASSLQNLLEAIKAGRVTYDDRPLFSPSWRTRALTIEHLATHSSAWLTEQLREAGFSEEVIDALGTLIAQTQAAGPVTYDTLRAHLDHASEPPATDRGKAEGGSPGGVAVGAAAARPSSTQQPSSRRAWVKWLSAWALVAGLLAPTSPWAATPAALQATNEQVDARPVVAAGPRAVTPEGGVRGLAEKQAGIQKPLATVVDQLVQRGFTEEQAKTILEEQELLIQRTRPDLLPEEMRRLHDIYPLTALNVLLHGASFLYGIGLSVLLMAAGVAGGVGLARTKKRIWQWVSTLSLSVGFVLFVVLPLQAMRLPAIGAGFADPVNDQLFFAPEYPNESMIVHETAHVLFPKADHEVIGAMGLLRAQEVFFDRHGGTLSLAGESRRWELARQAWGLGERTGNRLNAWRYLRLLAEGSTSEEAEAIIVSGIRKYAPVLEKPTTQPAAASAAEQRTEAQRGASLPSGLMRGLRIAGLTLTALLVSALPAIGGTPEFLAQLAGQGTPWLAASLDFARDAVLSAVEWTALGGVVASPWVIVPAVALAGLAALVWTARHVRSPTQALRNSAVIAVLLSFATSLLPQGVLPSAARAQQPTPIVAQLAPAPVAAQPVATPSRPSPETVAAIQRSLAGIGAYLTTVGVHGPTGAPQDSVQINPKTGHMIGNPANYGAPSKDGVYLPFLLHLAQGNPLLSQVNVSREQALRLMLRELGSLRRFQKDYEGREVHGGLFPWQRYVDDGSRRLTKYAGRRMVPSLDNGQLTMALAAVAGALWNAAPGTLERQVRDKAVELLDHQDYGKLVDPRTGLLFAEWSFDENRGLEKPGHATLWTEWAIPHLWALWTKKITTAAWLQFPNHTFVYNSPKGPIDMPQGYIFSAHELWYLQYLHKTLMKSKLGPLFLNYLYLHAQHARDNNMPGFAATEYHPNGQYSQGGIDLNRIGRGGRILDKINEEFMATPYGTALLALIDPSMAVWVGYLFQQPGVIQRYGPVTSFTRKEGASAMHTADNTFSTANALGEWYLVANGLPGGVNDGIAAYLRHRYGLNEGELVRAFDLHAERILQRTSQPAFRAVRPEDIPPPPDKKDFSVALRVEKKMPAESVSISDRLERGHWHGENVSVPTGYEQWIVEPGQKCAMRGGEIVADYRSSRDNR